MRGLWSVDISIVDADLQACNQLGYCLGRRLSLNLSVW